MKKRVIVLLGIILMVGVGIYLGRGKKTETAENNKVEEKKEENVPVSTTNVEDWRLLLANFEHEIPEDYEIPLANIDETRQFDARAIDDLNKMINTMRGAGVRNVWVQSAYRSVEKQKTLFSNKVAEYQRKGKSKVEAERLTKKVINEPGKSDHNLGLAVDFNYVDTDFDKTKAFNWLQKNAQDYGFILRYPKEKEEITKVTYEPWHWRYVGREHAKKIKELEICLEEYVENR